MAELDEMVEVRTTLDKVAVILGAGASKDAFNETGPPRNQSWQPPLAAELFGQRPAFWPVMAQYSGVRVLASELGEMMRRGANLEVKLREYAEHSDRRIREHFNEVPAYLRDLIISVWQNFTNTISPGTHLHLVTRLLSLGINVAFIDLNYDPYIETALADFDATLKIMKMADYVAEGRQAIVGKVHGSIDWGTPLLPDVEWKEAIRRFNPHARGETILQPSRRLGDDWWHQKGTRLYPVLTAPLAGKGPMDLVCPREHTSALQTFLKDCRHFLVIGTSAQDADLLDLLGRSVSKPRVVHYVSESPEHAAAAQGRLESACPQFRGGTRLLYGAGFREYLCGDEFATFLS
jgi:SIR2-like domain